MEFTVDYNFKDYYEIQISHYRASFHKKLTLVLGILVLLFEVYLILARIIEITTIIFIFLGIFCIFFEHIALKPKLKKDYKIAKHMHDPFKYKIDSEGIRLTNSFEDIKLNWKAFISYKDYKKVIILYRDPNSITGIPKHYLNNEELAKLNKILKENIKIIK